MSTDLRHKPSPFVVNPLLRRRRTIDSPADAVVERDGRGLLNFAGNNYLGLATHPKVIAAAEDAVRRWGAGSGASPLIIGHQRIHAELEAAIAEFKGTEAALVFPTGFAANLGVVSALAGRSDFIFCDRLNHASLIDGCRLSVARTRYWPHGDLDRLRSLLHRCIEHSKFSRDPIGERSADERIQHGEEALTKGSFKTRRFIVTDGVFSMDGDIAPLPELSQLAREFDATLIIDDAHATGVLGSGGRGTLEHFGLPDEGIVQVETQSQIPSAQKGGRYEVVQIGTLSKALGAAGGFVCGSREMIEWIVNRCRSYIYSTALAPPAAAAALAALKIVTEQPQLRERQNAHVRRLHRELTALGLRLYGDSTAPLLAVHVGDAAEALRWSALLEARGILAPAIRPPTVPAGTSRIRLSPMATHDEEQMGCVVEALRQCQMSRRGGQADVQ